MKVCVSSKVFRLYKKHTEGDHPMLYISSTKYEPNPSSSLGDRCHTNRSTDGHTNSLADKHTYKLKVLVIYI